MNFKRSATAVVNTVKHVAHSAVNHTKELALVGGVAVSSLLPAQAQTADTGAIDVADVKAKILAQLGPIGLLGGAVLLVVVAIAAFIWVRRAAK